MTAMFYKEETQSSEILKSMKSSFFTHGYQLAKRLIASALVCLAMATFLWQGNLFADNSAIALPQQSVLATSNLNKAENKAQKDAEATKGFVRDTANKVEKTARKNADRVDEATDGSNVLARKAQRDAGRIEQRAEQDAARTQKAIDDTKNVFERAVDGVKDALN